MTVKNVLISLLLIGGGFLAYSYNAIPMHSTQLTLVDANVSMPEPLMSDNQKTIFYNLELLGYSEGDDMFLMTMVAEDPFQKASIEDLDRLEEQMNVYAQQMGGRLAAGIGQMHSEQKRIMVQGRPGIRFENSINDATILTQCVIEDGKAIMQIAIYRSSLKNRFAAKKFMSSVEFPS